MRSDLREEVEDLIERAKQVRQDIYDLDYDGDALYCLSNAIKALENI